jgi:predicted DNA-binding transcriptional regulator YafY
VLKYGPEVEVLAPSALREQIRTLVSEVQGLYKA